MAGSFSDFLENELIDMVLGTGRGTSADKSYTRKPRKFIALCSRPVNDSSVGTSIHELVGTSYERAICYTWDAASGGVSANTADITFPAAANNWGKAVGFAICDSKTKLQGNILAHGTLTVSKNVQTGDTPKFAAGDIDVTLN